MTIAGLEEGAEEGEGETTAVYPNPDPLSEEEKLDQAVRARRVTSSMMAGSVADWLAAGRERMFVGRSREREILSSIFRGQRRIVYVHGVGGIGKTALLRAALNEPAFRGAAVSWLDARSRCGNADAMMCALRDGARGSGCRVTVLDHFENVRPIEDWLREELLPSFREDCHFLFAGRSPLCDQWWADLGWGTLLESICLEPFDRADTGAYLRRRNIPKSWHEPLFAATHGHPLALSEIAKSALRAGRPVSLGDCHELIPRLLTQLVTDVPSAAHRRALQYAAVYECINEAQLRLELGEPGHVVFEWLRAQPYARVERDGLSIDPLVRDLARMDLRWRDPDQYEAMLRRTETAAVDLDKREFSDAVKTALRMLDRPDLLVESPLLGLQWIGQNRRTASASEAAQILADEIRAQCEVFLRSPKDHHYYAVLERTYLTPSAKQEVIAEELNMPFGTYRRHLTTAVRRLTKSLWQRSRVSIA